MFLTSTMLRGGSIPGLLKGWLNSSKARGVRSYPLAAFENHILTYTGFVFPFATVGTGITARQRAERGIRSLGSTQARGGLPAGMANLRFMQAQGRSTRPLRMYNVSAQELRRIPIDPRPLRAVRVA